MFQPWKPVVVKSIMSCILLCETNKGVPCLIVDKLYKFRRVGVLKDCIVKWRCTSKNCPSKCFTKTDNTLVEEEESLQHNHYGMSACKFERHVIHISCKKKAAEDIFVPPSLYQQTSDYVEYLAENYIGPKSRFPPEIWARPPTSSLRTTNGAESYHRH